MSYLENPCHQELLGVEGPMARKLKEQAERIEELENILTVIIDEGWLGGYHIEKCARKILWKDNE